MRNKVRMAIGAYLDAFGQVVALFLQCLHVHMHLFVRWSNRHPAMNARVLCGNV